jgi:predicted nucleic acid-binding protein
MIVYLDASAIVKLYVAEAGSEQVRQLVTQAELVGTALISRAEVVAALAKAIRTGVLEAAQAATAVQLFRAQWPDYARVQVTEATINRADGLAWTHGLRGYDAVHLASAVIWEETLGEPVLLATFDSRLHEAGSLSGLQAWPADPKQP